MAKRKNGNGPEEVVTLQVSGELLGLLSELRDETGSERLTLEEVIQYAAESILSPIRERRRQVEDLRALVNSDLIREAVKIGLREYFGEAYERSCKG